ncbi:hypothetical protein [Streptosporangium sp. NPDC002607]
MVKTILVPDLGDDLTAALLAAEVTLLTYGSSRDTGKTGHESILTPVSAGRRAVSGQP